MSELVTVLRVNGRDVLMDRGRVPPAEIIEKTRTLITFKAWLIGHRRPPMEMEDGS